MRSIKRIRLEACNICQLKCPECENPKRTNDSPLGSGYLIFENFKNLLEKNPSIKRVELAWSGEIFLNPHLSKIIKHAFKKRVLLSATGGVNLNSVSNKILSDLVKYNFSSLRVSIDGSCQKTYKKYRKGGDFKQVISNIRRINQYKKEYGSPYPSLSWQFILFDHNEHEIHNARKLAEKLNMDFFIKLPWNQKYSPKKLKVFLQKETQPDYTIKEESNPLISKDFMNHTCAQLWREPVINWDGELFGCCWNHNASFGNVFESGLNNTLNNKNYIYTKKMLAGKVPPRSDIMCTNCSIFKRRNKGHLNKES